MSTEPVWTVLKNEEGRRYYYNNTIKSTSWERPEEFRDSNPITCAWKKHSTPDGKKYYANTLTLATRWDAPLEYGLQQEYEKLKDEQEDIILELAGDDARDLQEVERDIEALRERLRAGHARFADMVFEGASSGELRYLQLLNELDVDETWNWEKTLTVTIFHSAYKAIPTLGERRAAFLRYQAELSRVTKTKREGRVALRRDAFLRVLSEYPSINVYSVWPKYADELKGRVELEGYAPKELQAFFREHITLLQTHKREEEARIRAENLEKFSTLLQSLPFAPDTTWTEAQASIQDTPLYQADEQLREGDPQAYVDAFDAHMDRLVEEDSARSRAEAEGIAIRAAEAREAFKALLHRLREAGEIGAATRWQDAYPLVAPHPAYRAMLESTAVAGGSSPQELLWDVVEDAYEPIYRRRKEIERYFKLRAYKPREDMTFDEFTAQLDPAVHFLGLSRRDMEMVHEEVQQKARFKARDERERAERAQKRRVNHLWATLADLRPPLLPNASWEAEYERIKDTDAVRDFPVVEECREAFEAYVSSMKD